MSGVTLAALSQQEYDSWSEETVRRYAAEKTRVGAWRAEEALARARAERERLLPDGPATPGHHLYSIRDPAGRHVGVVWLAGVVRDEQRLGFVYDLVVSESARRQGHGSAAMRLLEDEARRLGLASIMLHVFGGNRAALALYLKAGYEVQDYTLAKPLSPAS